MSENLEIKQKDTYTIYICLANGVQIPLSIKAVEILIGELTRIVTEAKEQGYE